MPGSSRPRAVAPEPPRELRSARPFRFFFALAVFLIIGAQIYVHHQKARWESAGNVGPGASNSGGAGGAGSGGNAETGPSAGTEIPISSPAGPVARDLLRLNWTGMKGADHYLLGIKTLVGGVVVDQLPVDETYWTVPLELLPALTTGGYTWQVSAVNAAGKVLARSETGAFQLE